uniref:Uncharacterized protein n=1 Tax=Oryza nivara TaxID=4536 RepID=A0A0E0HWD6_ORYNI
IVVALAIAGELARPPPPVPPAAPALPPAAGIFALLRSRLPVSLVRSGVRWREDGERFLAGPNVASGGGNESFLFQF